MCWLTQFPLFWRQKHQLELWVACGFSLTGKKLQLISSALLCEQAMLQPRRIIMRKETPRNKIASHFEGYLTVWRLLCLHSCWWSPLQNDGNVDPCREHTASCSTDSCGTVPRKTELAYKAIPLCLGMKFKLQIDSLESRSNLLSSCVALSSCSGALQGEADFLNHQALGRLRQDTRFVENMVTDNAALWSWTRCLPLNGESKLLLTPTELMAIKSGAGNYLGQRVT